MNNTKAAENSLIYIATYFVNTDIVLASQLAMVNYVLIFPITY